MAPLDLGAFGRRQGVSAPGAKAAQIVLAAE